MAKLAEGLTSSPPNGSELPRNGSDPNVEHAVGELAERMRGTVTPVIGYLELIAQEGHDTPNGRHLDWIATIERRLEAMRELNDQISRVCDVLRQSVSDREAASPRAPEAPEG